ncbi:MAG TPA: hypothetical protein VFE72_12075 [Lysobacter sp.]|nr:hypothetical protein [Lysobacter sp.]
MGIRGWSVTVNSDWGRRNSFINWLRINSYAVPGDYAGVHFALLGLNLCVTKYARVQA